MNKFSKEEKLEMVRLYNSGKTFKEVAEFLNVNYSSCCKIIKYEILSDEEKEEYRQKRRKICKNYRGNNKDKTREYYLNVVKPNTDNELQNEKQNKRRAKSPDKYRERDRVYYQKNREKILKHKNVYNKRPQRRKKINEYFKTKRQTDFNFKLGIYTRNRIKRLIKGTRLERPTQQLIGCNRETLIHHLESQFTEEMNWDNYGLGENKWCIDHITPLSWYDLSQPEQLLEACNYKNLQPMWCVDNFRKGNRYAG